VTVRSIRLLRSFEATFEYGTNNVAGALEVLTGAPRFTNGHASSGANRSTTGREP